MNKSELAELGFTVARGLLPKEAVLEVRKRAQVVFINQFVQRKFDNALDDAPDAFLRNMKRLFDESFDTFFNCGKQCQHLISLHTLGLRKEFLEVLSWSGLKDPVISTRPVLYFNHPSLAKEERYWRMTAHQDWRSMQGSLNSLVIWVPLVDVDRDMGTLEVVPGSHKRGLLRDEPREAFSIVEPIPDSSFQSTDLEVGDALIFSAFLVHRSGTLKKDAIRWSCHFRYNDLREPTFSSRGYPHPYIYRPIEDLIHPNFPSPGELEGLFSD